MNIINEIGDTPKGQEMLGRTAERAYQRAQRTSGADKKRYMRTYNDAYKTGGKSSNKHLGGSREHFDNGRDYEYEKWADEHNGNVAESKNMNKKIIRLTESDLHKIVKESVNRVLTELDWKTYANAARKRALQGADDKVIGDLDAAANKGLEKYDIGSEQPLYGYKNAPRLKTTKQDSWGNKFARQELKMPEHERYSDNYSAYDHGTGFDGTADISLSKIGGNRDARKDIGDYFRGNSKYIKGQGWQ